MPSLRLAPAGLRRTALALPLLLAACASFAPPPPPGPPRQLSVERAEQTLTLYFATDIAQPSAEERGRLAAFLHGLDPQGRRTFRVSGHADDRASEAYNLDLSARRARAVAELIEDRGFAAGEITTMAFGERAPAYPGTSDSARSRNRRVDIAVDGWTVGVAGCPDWRRDPGDTAMNEPLGNLGCANLVNLGLMVADPAALLRGRPLGPADGTREAEAVVRYRTDKVKDLQEGLITP